MGLGGLSYPNEFHLKKKIIKKKSSQMVGSVGSHTILRSYAILPFLRSFYDFKLFGEVGS